MPLWLGIEDAAGCLQADFANKYIGGGVLCGGCVQEEIRFSLCPELTASLAFTQVMKADESVIITGSEQFSAYTGYMFTLAFDGDHRDMTQRDQASATVLSCVAAIDAEVMEGGVTSDQLEWPLLRRELVKAHAGFVDPVSLQHMQVRETKEEGEGGGAAHLECGADRFPQGHLYIECGADRFPQVATGNWGCGVFNGHLGVKALVQWAAASHLGHMTRGGTRGAAEGGGSAAGPAAAARKVKYYPFSEEKFAPELDAFVQWASNAFVVVQT
jgi:poly(ADP-ribose) glycohydrolase